MAYYLIPWGEEPFVHIHTHFQRNWTNNVNFTAYLMRVGQVSKVTISQLGHTDHTHTQHSPATRVNTLCGIHVTRFTCTSSPHAVDQSMDPDLGQSATLILEESDVWVCGFTRYWTLWPNHTWPRWTQMPYSNRTMHTLEHFRRFSSISLKIGVNVQEWFLSPTVPNNKPYVHTHVRYLSKHCCVQNVFWVV